MTDAVGAPELERREASAPPRVDRAILLAAVVGIAVAVILVGVRLVDTGGDVTAFIHAGDVMTRADIHDAISVEEGVGYDGQYFYRLALDPFTSEQLEHGVKLDDPAYRHQRVVYPTLAWLVGFAGEPLPVAWGLVVVNVLAMGAVGGLGALLARSLGASPWVGLLFLLNPAYWVSLSLDTAELVAGAFLLASLVALRTRSWPAATVLLVVAMLSRETTLVVAAALGIAYVAAQVRGRPRPCPAYVVVVPWAGYVVWRAALGVHWAGSDADSRMSVNFSAPLTGLVDRVGHWIDTSPGEAAGNLAMLAALVLLFALAAVAAARGAGTPAERCMLGLGVVGMLFWSNRVWVSPETYLRVAGETTAIAILLVVAARVARDPVVERVPPADVPVAR